MRHSTLHSPASKFTRRLHDSWRYLRFAALLLVAAASPRIHTAAQRRISADVLCTTAWQSLPAYLLACILISAVLTRMVAVTAQSYGLSHLALEAILRVYVLELLPLASTLFVALRAVPLAMLRIAPQPGRVTAVQEIVPYMTGNAAAVFILAVLGGLASLSTAYLVVHGLSLWGLPAFSRLLGLVFDPLFGLLLLAKLACFALAVGIAPTTVALDPNKADPGFREMRVMVRLLLVLVLIETAFLMLRRF